MKIQIVPCTPVNGTAPINNHQKSEVSTMLPHQLGSTCYTQQELVCYQSSLYEKYE